MDNKKHSEQVWHKLMDKDGGLTKQQHNAFHWPIVNGKHWLLSMQDYGKT